jgi:hypothetical protein
MNKPAKVKILHRINRLKRKAAAGTDGDETQAGFIDPAAVTKAQAAIDGQAGHYPEEVCRILDKLENSWNELKAEKDSRKAQTFLSWLYNYANNIKDMAETYHYGLMAHFGKSLRDFCEYIDIAKPAHHVIAQAHIDVMRIVYNENIRDLGNPKAEELKMIVAKAIEKYS